MHLLLLLLKLGRGGQKIHGLLISVQTKVEDVDKIFDRVGICVTRETGRLSILIFLLTPRLLTLAAAWGGNVSKKRKERLRIDKIFNLKFEVLGCEQVVSWA